MYAPRTFLEEVSPFHNGLPMLFVHTPKCGGKFLGTAFHRHMKKCISLREPSLRGHLTWLEYKHSLSAIGIDINKYTTFSVVRNPFSWHVSWYTYIRGPKGGKRSGYQLEHELFSKMAFSDYVKWLSDPDAERTKRFDMGKQVSDWVLDEDGKIAVDHVLRQETLIDDLKRLAFNHHLRLRIPKKRINVSNEKQDYREFYTAEDVDVIAGRHQKDLSLFEYAF